MAFIMRNRGLPKLSSISPFFLWKRRRVPKENLFFVVSGRLSFLFFYFLQSLYANPAEKPLSLSITLTNTKKCPFIDLPQQPGYRSLSAKTASLIAICWLNVQV
jgi:hypothetical protein